MAQMGGSNRLLTVDEVATLLSIPKKTVYAEWRTWGLPALRIGKHLRFRERALEDFLSGCEIR